jgi:hypothetical protein
VIVGEGALRPTSRYLGNDSKSLQLNPSAHRPLDRVVFVLFVREEVKGDDALLDSKVSTLDNLFLVLELQIKQSKKR